MKTDDFDYFLPQELIAQSAQEDRPSCRLLVVHRDTGEIEDRHFYDITDYLREGDCLVMNDSRVIPARIYGIKDQTGARIEFLLHKRFDEHNWEVMARPGKRLKIGTKVVFSDKPSARVKNKKEDGLIDVEFSYEGSFFEILHEIGTMPLPPYIHEKLKNQDDYQTVYARTEGSSAAPTAGLHFTNELLDTIRSMGVKTAFVTLHVGLGTFLPVSSDNIEEHQMHSEYYEISPETASVINETREKGGRIICVGTTSVRTLESCAMYNEGRIVPESRDTSIFIYPGFEYKVTDCLITNFHLPKSTLIMLVAAFYDREKILKVYEHAVKERYRFFSFGDAMLLL